MDVNEPLKRLTNPDNLVDRLAEAEAEASPGTSAYSEQASMAAESSGDMIVDNLIAPAPGVEVMDVTSTDFTGTFISGEGQTFDGTVYNFGGVNSGILQAGMKQTDGTFIAGSGAVTLDSTGISILSGTDTAAFFPERTIKFTDANGNTVFRTGAWVDATNEINSLTIQGISSTDFATHEIEITLDVQTDFGNGAQLSLVSDTAGASNIGFVADTISIEGNTVNFPTGDVTIASGGRIKTTSGFFSVGSPTTLTISGGVVTVSKSYHLIDTQGGAATDDLDTINGGSVGDILILRSANNARDTTVKDGTGNIQLAGDFLLSNTSDTITLFYTGTNWLELGRSDNA